MNLYGLYRGICVTSADPEALMRVRVQVPQVTGEQSTEWALPCVPPGVTATRLPRPGEGVWVMFEAGDVTKPVWVGVWKRSTA